MQVVGYRFQGIPSSAVPLALGKQLVAAANVWGRRITERAIMVSPKETGRLAASHYWTVSLESNGHLVLIVGNRAPYAAFVHQGTRPHEIRPRNASALRFVKGGVVIFAAVVHHPGTRPQPWLWLSTTSVLSALSSSTEQLVSVSTASNGLGEVLSAAS